MPFALIPFLLLAIPVLEIAVFIVIGREIGVLATLGFILLTAVIGSVLLRFQGFSIVRRIQSELDQGRVPGRELGDGLMIIIAAVLLLTPGFVTDTLGFLLFVPAVRSALWRLVASRIKVQIIEGRWSQQHHRCGTPPDGPIVDLDANDFSKQPETRPERTDNRLR